MRLASGVSMNVSVEAPRTHHSAQQGQVSLAPPRVPPGARPSQPLLPATRWALRPPVTPIPIPPARTTACPPKPAVPTGPNAPGAASRAPAGVGTHGDVRHLGQSPPARGFPRQSVPSNRPASAFDLRLRTLRYAVTTVVLCRP